MCRSMRSMRNSPSGSGSRASGRRNSQGGRVSTCIFCRIVEGSIPAKVVYQDEETVAFDDITPQAPVHTLVIPKRHVAAVQDLGEADQALLGRLLLACRKVAMDKGLAETGYRIVA